MLKKWFLLFVTILSLLFSSQASASFSIISDDFFFFQNKNTSEIKYVNVKTYHSRFFFNYYLLNVLDKAEIWGPSKLQNWRLVRIESKLSDLWKKGSSPSVSHYLSGEIDVWSFGINLPRDGFSAPLTDVSYLQKLGFQDLTREECIKFYFQMFLDFFWVWFLLFLPLNIIIFFCFGYLLFLLYEKFWWSIFKYVYVNSFFVYLITYLTLIYNGLSFLQLTSGELFWFSSYFFFVGLPKFMLYSISYRIFKEYHQKYPEKKVIYKHMLLGYAALFCLFVIGMQINNRFF